MIIVKMKIQLTLFFVLSFWINLLAQSNNCISKLDSSKVIKIAKRNNSYWTKYWVCSPKLYFNDTTCAWTVTSGRQKFSNKGQCKYTNGCTITEVVTLVIDAKTGRVRSRKVNSHTTYNYER